MTIQEYNDLYKNPIVKKMMITSSGGIAITNPNIVSEQMTIEDALCSGTNLTYGACESACFKIRIADLNHNFEGEWLDVYQKLVTDEDGYLMLEDGGYLLQESGYRIQLESQGEATAHIGKFKVLSDKPTSDRRWRDLTCYDMMRDIINMDVFEWYASLTFPMTIKQLRDSFFAYIQVPQQTTTLINDSFVVIGDFAVGGTLSGKDVITSICELNGVFGHISRDGVFEYISLPSAETITLDWYVNGSGTYEDYVCDKITGITAKSNADGDIGTTVGTEDNLYQISGNLMIVGQEGTAELSAALTTLLNAIKDNQYRPFTVKTYGNPMLAVGTSIVINTRDKVINSFVMAKTMTGIQSLKDDLSAKGNKTYPIDANSLQRQINNVSGAVNGVKSEIKKTNNEIVLKVDDNGNIVKVALGTDAEHGTTFKVTADNIDFIANGVMNLTANNIGISATNFSIDKDTGNVVTTGNMTATAIKIYDKIIGYNSELDTEFDMIDYSVWQGLIGGRLTVSFNDSDGNPYLKYDTTHSANVAPQLSAPQGLWVQGDFLNYSGDPSTHVTATLDRLTVGDKVNMTSIRSQVVLTTLTFSNPSSVVSGATYSKSMVITPPSPGLKPIGVIGHLGNQHFNDYALYILTYDEETFYLYGECVALESGNFGTHSVNADILWM